MLIKLWHRMNGHPPEQVWLGAPDADHYSVAGCTGCWERWVSYDRRVSASFVAGLREFGMDEKFLRRIERVNAEYAAQRTRGRELAAPPE